MDLVAAPLRPEKTKQKIAYATKDKPTNNGRVGAAKILHIQRRVLELEPKWLHSNRCLTSNETRLIRSDEHLLMKIVLEFFLTENSSVIGNIIELTCVHSISLLSKCGHALILPRRTKA